MKWPLPDAKGHDALLAAKSSLVDDLLSSPQWHEELSDVIAQRGKAGSRDL
jgi:hypothetical protein